LRQIGALPGDHDRQPGARSLLALRGAARETGARCLLQERGDNPALAATLVRDLGLHAVEVDPLARTSDSFDAFLARFAADVQRCLAPAPPIPGDRP
jgi:ABC-type Zn2+ transport system substrate-binding protein/surface adhesin